MLGEGTGVRRPCRGYHGAVLYRDRYTHLRDAARLMAGPLYLPAEVMWTMYADQALTFTLAHELMHIQNGDLAKPGGAFTEEMVADMGAADLAA
jgi:hypothetical protein